MQTKHHSSQPAPHIYLLIPYFYYSIVNQTLVTSLITVRIVRRLRSLYPIALYFGTYHAHCQVSDRRIRVDTAYVHFVRCAYSQDLAGCSCLAIDKIMSDYSLEQ